MNPRLISLLSCFLALPIATVLAQTAPTHDATASTSAAHGIARDHFDLSVTPGDDFFRYANGGWLSRSEIPADRAAIGVFTLLDDVANQRTAQIVQEAVDEPAAPDAPTRKVADLYRSYMNETKLESLGLTALQPELQAIAAIQDKHALAAALGDELRADVDPLNDTNFHTLHLFGLWVAPGFHDSAHYHAYLLQGGLAMPNRDFYLGTSAHMRDIQAKYLKHVATLLRLAGYADSDARAAHIVALENALAAAQVSLAESEEIDKADNRCLRADFAKNAPGLDWAAFFRAAGLAQQNEFTVWQPSAVRAEAALVAREPLTTWKDWLLFHRLEESADALPQAFADEHYDFFGKTLSGTPQRRPRSERAVRLVSATLGDVIGQAYAARYFSPDAKANVQTMVGNILAAFRQRIDQLDWMAPTTKAEAKAKLQTLYVGIGYPETWTDYSKLEIRADDLLGNLERRQQWEYRRQRARLGTAVDRHEWSMTPQTVNAVNLPLQNALNFPAAILQPPFFDPKASAAVNYGAIGAIIGHEISHTFDTEGSTFDATGAVRNWWTKEDLQHFTAATEKLAAQYDAYKPFADLAVNGHQTLAENIADVAGLAAAYDAYQTALGGKPAPAVDGFSGDQQFFLAFAQSWASKARDAAQRQQVLTDPHAPARYRAATVRNLDAWYRAFAIPAGAQLYLPPTQRVRIW